MLSKKQLQKIRANLRKRFGYRPTDAIPISFLDKEGKDCEPELSGKSGGYFTKAGYKISKPSAYKKKGWSNMEYRKSTKVITVGEDWLTANLDSLIG